MKDLRLINEIEHGEKIASKGEEVWNWSTPAGKVRLKRRSQMLKKFIGNKNKKVLELGCGTGIFTKEIAATDNKIFAIDISPSLLQLARQRVKTDNVKFILDNAYKTKFKDNYFDYIVGSSILHHLDVDLAIKEIYRLLKPGGGFIFTEPNMLNPQIALERNVPLIRKIANNSKDESAFIKKSIRKKLLESGFYKLKIKTFDFLHPLTPALLIKTVSKLGNLLEKTLLLKEIGGSLVISGWKEGDYQRLKRYQKVWQRKKILRQIYNQFYREIDKNLNSSGQTLELGSGIGNFKKFKPDIISSDIVKADWQDMNFDAHSIPFPNNHLANIVMIDVLHHLARPINFLNEAHRVLKRNGRLILNEPYPSPFSFLVYKLFHPEPFIFKTNYFSKKEMKKGNNLPWSANQAIPYLIFFKQIRKFNQYFGKKFKIIKRDRISLLVYPLSGGFENKQLVPDAFFPLLGRLEKRLSLFKNWLAFRCYVVLQKQ